MAGNSTEPGQSVTSRVSAILLAFTDYDDRSLTTMSEVATAEQVEASARTASRGR